MLILGLLLLACTGAFTGLALSDNLRGGPDYGVTVLGQHIATMNSLAIFCAGLGLALLFGLGALMAKRGLSLRQGRFHTLSATRQNAARGSRGRDEQVTRLDRADTAAPGYRASDRTPDRASDTTANRDADRNSDDAGYPSARARDLAANRGRGESGATRAVVPRRRHARHLFGH